MNKKVFFLVLPAAILQYVSLLCLSVVLFSTKNDAMRFVMERVFNSNALVLIAIFLIYAVVSFLLAFICFLICIIKKCDPLVLAKTAMVIKLIQIPAYIGIFVLSILFIITIFTFGFAIALFIVDCLCLFVSGMLNVIAMFLSVKERYFKLGQCIPYIVFQFVFCADLISSVLFYRKLKKAVAPCSVDDNGV